MTPQEIRFREVKDENLELKSLVKEQKLLIESLRVALELSTKQNQELTVQISYLNEQLESFKKLLFGTSSEKRTKKTEENETVFNEAEKESNPEAEEPTKETIVKKQKTRKSKTKLEDKIKGLEVEQVIVELSEEDKFCPWCNTQLVEIGREVVRHELEFIPAKVRIIEYVSVHYSCPQCKDDGESFIKKAPLFPALMKHSLASPSVVSWIMSQKYGNGMPLFRLEKEFNEFGIDLSRSTMSNWVIYCALHYLKPIYDYCHKALLKREFLMADETRIQVLHEEDRKATTDSFMWAFRSGEDGLAPIILYKYSQTRSGDVAKEFLENFCGYLMVDGYNGYNKVEGIKRCCCFAHMRRYFNDAIPKGHTYDYSLPAVQGVEYFTKLFHYEEIFKEKGYSYEQRKASRLQFEKPVLEAFLSWLENQTATRNSKLDKALTYAKNRKDIMFTYLEDGRCSISNNASERNMKSFVIGRKAWLFADTPSGAEASAIVYSMVEMAKENGLNIHSYLNFLLKKRPSNNMSDEELEQLAPWGAAAVLECSTKK